MSFKAKPWITWSLKCVISAGILYVIFTNIPLSAVGSVVTSAKPALVGLAILLGFVMRYVAAYRMKILTSRQGLSPSTWQIYKINLMTSFYGMFLPGYLAGGAIRWYKLARLDNKPSEALISIVVNRWFQTVTVILLGLGFWSADEHARDHGWIGSTLLGLLGLFLILYVLVFNRTVAAGVSRRVGRLRFLPENLRGWLQQTFEAAGMYGGLQKRVVTKLWLLSFAAESIGICSFLCFAGSLELGLTPVNAGWIRSFALLVAMIPISFSGLGVRDGTLIYLLGPYAIEPAGAVALSLLLFGRILISGAVGGMLEALHHLLPARTVSPEESPS